VLSKVLYCIIYDRGKDEILFGRMVKSLFFSLFLVMMTTTRRVLDKTFAHRISTVPILWPRPCVPWSHPRRPAYKLALCAGRSWPATRAPAGLCRSRKSPRRTADGRWRVSRSCWCSAWTRPRRWYHTRRKPPLGSPKICEQPETTKIHYYCDCKSAFVHVVVTI